MEEVVAISPVTSVEGRSVLQGRYEIGRVIGQGTFAKVHVARNLLTGEGVAIKVVGKEKVMQVGMMEQVKREISVMKMVRHPNIVELHEVMATRSKIYFAMELVRGGELFTKVARSGRLREDAARRYFRQLVSAVDFCHGRGVYHRDLKLENILLDERGDLKIADFGLSAFADHVRPDGLFHTACGTPAYVAPEVVGQRGYDGAKADLWSCGVILFVLLAGFLPFQDENILAMYKKIRRGDFRCPPWFSSDARRLVTKLLDPNPKTRITIDRLMGSSWFKKSTTPKSVTAAPPSSASLESELSGDKEPAKKEGEEPERLNAFHLISFSEGFDLSPLFLGGERREKIMRFATKEPASGVASRLEAARGRCGQSGGEVPGDQELLDRSEVGGRGTRSKGQADDFHGHIHSCASSPSGGGQERRRRHRRVREILQRRAPPRPPRHNLDFIIRRSPNCCSPMNLHQHM